MTTIRAIVSDPTMEGRLRIEEVESPRPDRGEALVRVAAISLNRGETRRAMTATARWRPGWDFAGTVEAAAADGSGPAAGQRVVGLLQDGAWAEIVAVPTHALAVLPDAVSFAAASTLPVAGLTALHALEKGGSLLARKVLITGASGGVGHLATQLGAAMGADVTALVRQQGHVEFMRAAGAHHVVVDETGADVAEHGRYHVILESVGGEVLVNALKALAPGGVCLTVGGSGGTAMADLRGVGAARGSFYWFSVFRELGLEPAGQGLARLAGLIADGRLRPHIDVEAPWTEIAAVAQQLIDRRYPGKAVLHVQ